MSLARTRSHFKTLARKFFRERGVLEVDTPHIQPCGSLDTYIEAMEVVGEGYLHTSPEYWMKKLIESDPQDIYQICHVFRKNEKGRLHHPEFTMIEYYRMGMEYSLFIEEVLDLIRLFIGPQSATYLPHQEALEKYAHLPSDDLNITWGNEVEPNLQDLTVITDYPKEEAALARIVDGTARRFEVYYKGIELANGYDELTEHPDYRIPPCCGVALGFDRLLMLHLGEPSISSSISLKIE